MTTDEQLADLRRTIDLTIVGLQRMVDNLDGRLTPIVDDLDGRLSRLEEAIRSDGRTTVLQQGRSTITIKDDAIVIRGRKITVKASSKLVLRGWQVSLIER